MSCRISSIISDAPHAFRFADGLSPVISGKRNIRLMNDKIVMALECPLSIDMHVKFAQETRPN